MIKPRVVNPFKRRGKRAVMIKEIFIHSFESVFPSHRMAQTKINDWLHLTHLKNASLQDEDSEKSLNFLRRFCLSDKYIEQRYTDCAEVDEDWESHEIYCLKNDSPQGALIDKRNEYFGKKVRRVFEKLYHDHHPPHLIHVTCTGYLSPSPAQDYFSSRDNPPEITHAYQMGCYASLPAIRMALGMCFYQKSTIDIIHTEMCSIHLNPSLHTPEQMVVQSLFADGHIKYSVGESEKGFKVLAILEKLIPDSGKDMTWIPGQFGMAMTLSKEVPLKIREMIPSFVDELCAKASVLKQDILQSAIFAIHPGGPQIIEAVTKKLELKNEQVVFSHKVLKERGNMSSATLPHVWQEIWESRPCSGQKVLSLAFGPGLTIFGSIFEVRD